MSQINDAYADYEANRGFYQSESPTFNRGSKGTPSRSVDKFDRQDIAVRTSDRHGRQRKPGMASPGRKYNKGRRLKGQDEYYANG